MKPERRRKAGRFIRWIVNIAIRIAELRRGRR